MVDGDRSSVGFVSELALDIDRLFIAGHRAAAPHARPLLAEFGLPGFGVLVDLRKLLLAPSGMELWRAEAVERYNDPRQIADTLEIHVGQGLVRSRASTYLPTPGGRELLLRLTGLLENAVDGLWYGEPGLSAGATASAVVGRANTSLPEDLYPAFASESRGYMPDAPGVPFVMWSSLASLRYLRADDHALAWSEKGLSPREISVLSALCNKDSPAAVTTLIPVTFGGEDGIVSALASLRFRGWARETGDKWETTEEGKKVRQQIEHRTNELNAQHYAELGMAERAALRAALRSLPPSPP